mgnify:CR=1 FL=1
MTKDEIMKQFDEAIKNLREWVEEKEPKPKCKHELDDNVLLTHPPKYICKKCGELFQSILCVNQEDPKPEWEDRYSLFLSKHSLGPYDNNFEKVKDFIRQEFKDLCSEINREYCMNEKGLDETINEALRKRGVK